MEEASGQPFGGILPTEGSSGSEWRQCLWEGSTSGGSGRCSPSPLVAGTLSQSHPCSGVSGGRCRSRQAHHRSAPKTTSLDTLDWSEVRTTRNLFQKLTTARVEGHLGVLLSDPPDVADVFSTERWPEPLILLEDLGTFAGAPSSSPPRNSLLSFFFIVGRNAETVGWAEEMGPHSGMPEAPGLL